MPKVRKLINSNNVDFKGKRKKFIAEDIGEFPKYKKNMTISQRDKWFRGAVRVVRSFIADGLSRTEIMLRLNINEKQYDRIEVNLIENDGAQLINSSVAQLYLFYVLRMEGCIRQIDSYIQAAPKHDAKIINAVKTKAGLLKDILTTGQDMGVINKKAKEVRVLGDINLAVMDTDHLQNLMFDRLKDFNKLIGKEEKTLPTAYERILDSNVKKSERIIDAEYIEETNEEPQLWEDT